MPKDRDHRVEHPSGIWLRSEAELRVANVLDQLGVGWAYEPQIRNVVEPGRYMLPDFAVPATWHATPLLGCFVEVKDAYRRSDLEDALTNRLPAWVASDFARRDPASFRPQVRGCRAFQEGL